MTNASKGAPEIYSSEEIKKLRNEAKIANGIIGTKNLFFENLPACFFQAIELWQY